MYLSLSVEIRSTTTTTTGVPEKPLCNGTVSRRINDLGCPLVLLHVEKKIVAYTVLK
jgi:hypothetical protein